MDWWHPQKRAGCTSPLSSPTCVSSSVLGSQRVRFGGDLALLLCICKPNTLSLFAGMQSTRCSLHRGIRENSFLPLTLLLKNRDGDKIIPHPCPACGDKSKAITSLKEAARAITPFPKQRRFRDFWSVDVLSSCTKFVAAARPESLP